MQFWPEMDDLRECYRMLEVDPGASPELVKRAYRDLVKVWHPDRFTDDPGLQSRAQEKLKQINLAYGKAREARVILPPQPPPAAASRRPAPPVWTPNDAAPDDDHEPPGAPPRRKRNWEPALARAGLSFIIVFELAVVPALCWVIITALAG